MEGDAPCGTRYVYDLAGRLTGKWVPVREEGNTAGGGTGRVLYNVTLYAYDAEGNRVLERRSPDEVAEGDMPSRFLDIRMYYDKQNRLMRVEDSLGAAAEYTYDCLDNRLTEKYRVSEDTYRLIRYRYDAAGRLTERMESVDRGDLGLEEKTHCQKEFLRTAYAYDKNGNVIKITLPNGGEVLREYDVMDRVVRETIRDKKSGIDRTVCFAYDAAGKLLFRTSADGSVYSYAYDACGRLLSETDEEGGTTRYFHNRNGELVKAVSADNYDSTKDDGPGYTFAYDVFGRLREVRDVYGNLREADTYDGAGRLLGSRDSAGLLFSNEYDPGGRKTAVSAGGAGSPAQTFTYDSLGNITGIMDGEQNRTSFELDDWGRITTLHAPDGSSETYAYETMRGTSHPQRTGTGTPPPILTTA